MGETVALLALIDLYRPGLIVFNRVDGWKRALRQEGPRQLATRLLAKINRDGTHILRSLVVRYHLARSSAVPHELRDFWLTESFLESAENYRLRPYRGKLTVIRARDINPIFGEVVPDLGWSPLALHGVETIEVPGDHHTLTREPNVRVLAAQLEACVRAADEHAEPGPGPGQSSVSRNESP